MSVNRVNGKFRIMMVKKYSCLLLFLTFLMAQSTHAQLIHLRAKQRNDQKIGLHWFFKGENVTTSLNRRENIAGAVYEKIADINLSDESYIDDFNFNPNSRYLYRFSYNGEVYETNTITYDFSAFDLLPPRNVFFYKSEGNIHLFWTDVTHREDAYLVLDQSSNVLETVGINETHVVFKDEGWDNIYVAAKGNGIETEKVIASQIEPIDFESELTEEEPLVAVCPNWPYKDGVHDILKNVDINVSGFIDYLIQDSSLRNKIDVIKFYSQTGAIKQETMQKLVNFQKAYDKMIAIEVGGVRQKSTDNKLLAGEVCAARDIQNCFLPIFNAGGTVDFIETDNSVLFTAWGGKPPPESVTNPLNLTISEVAKEQADYFEYIHQRFPEMKFGVIENLRVNHFGEWKGKKNPVGSSQKGLEDMLFQLNVQMRSKGLRLNHFNAELAAQDMGYGFDDYNYKKLLAVSDYCTSLGIKFAKLFNATGGTSSNEAFFNSTVQFYLKAKEEYKLKTYIDVFQSWAPVPTTIYGDDDPYSFTNIIETLILDESIPVRR